MNQPVVISTQILTCHFICKYFNTLLSKRRLLKHRIVVASEDSDRDAPSLNVYVAVDKAPSVRTVWACRGLSFAHPPLSQGFADRLPTAVQ